MEYIPGVKIDNLDKIDKLGLNRTIISRRLAESYMIQLCEHGFFHCDPHVCINYFLMYACEDFNVC
jgi:predicted unusual protein kinase regulating ubiquinone biosynthesis (AarF/ABC1/UbiB family)